MTYLLGEKEAPRGEPEGGDGAARAIAVGISEANRVVWGLSRAAIGSLGEKEWAWWRFRPYR